MPFLIRLLPLLICLLVACPGDIAREQFVTPIMGTDLTLLIEGSDSARIKSAAQAVQAEVERLNNLFSTWIDTSALAMLNRKAGEGWTEAAPEILSVLRVALEYSAASHGAFDITAGPLVRLWGFFARVERRPPNPEDIARTLTRIGSEKLDIDFANGRIRFDIPGMEIDLGAIAKGYAVDRARDVLRSKGIGAALVNLGGNISFFGLPKGRDSWSIAVRDPRSREGLLGTLNLGNNFAYRGIASSGQYERFFEYEGRRYGHIIDPRSGYPVEGILGTTIIAPDATRADALSTTTFVLGPDHAVEFVRELEDVLAIIVLVSDDGSIHMRISHALRPYFELAPEAGEVLLDSF